MTKLAHVERERAIGMLKANVTPLVVVKRFRCHVWTIGRLKNRFQQIGTASHRPRPRHRRMWTRSFYLCPCLMYTSNEDSNEQARLSLHWSNIVS